ncbi:MAG: LPS export ABC transporter ATP-binding protein [Armatimonadetes bacterium]|nr:LPS export ABC transporter ATP-binding protein [Armatimonadota bacterium]
MATLSGISVKNLTKAYKGRTVVDGVSLEIKQGEIVGLLGPNGAGKTTTFYMIVGLVRPNSGTVLLDGKDITNMPMYQRARHGIGYLAQEPSVFRKLSVSENILLVLEAIGMPRKERIARLDQLLDELKLRHVKDHKAYMLSGGERRRTEIARALACSPKFMLLDEPFTGVDPIAIADIQDIIVELRKKGIGVVITDHNVRETLSITDRAYILSEGQIKTSGLSTDLPNDPIARKYYLGDRFEV